MKFILICLLTLSLIFTTGCWDQKMLKDLNLALAAGLDITSNNKLETSITIPYIQKSSGQTSGSITNLKVLNIVAPTPRQTRNIANNMIPKSIEVSKLLSLGLGEKLAKTHIFPYLDIFYRDPRSSLNAKLYLADGKATDIIHLQNKNNPRIGVYLSELIKSSEDVSLLPKTDIQRILADMMDPGADFVLPFVTINKKNQTIVVNGVALFHGDTYTGTSLDEEDSTLLQLLKGVRGNSARQTIKTFRSQKAVPENYVNINVKYTHPHLKIKMNKHHKPVVNLNVNIGFRVEEYPHDKLLSDKEKITLNKKISNALTKRSQHVINVLQKNNCDVFAIGRRINAFYHNDWVAMDQKNYFKHINFKVKVNTRLLEQGVIY